MQFKFVGSTETALGGVSDPVVLSNGSLRLETARAEHSGKYRCRAENGVAPALSKTLTIHVNGKYNVLAIKITSFHIYVCINALNGNIMAQTICDT